MSIDNIQIDGDGRDDEGNRYVRLLIQGEKLVVPVSEIVERPKRLFTRVNNAGASLLSSASQQQFIKLLESRDDDVRFRVVDRLGWDSDFFASPLGVFGATKQEVELSSPFRVGLATKFRVSKSLDTWKSDVANLAEGNSRFMFCIAAMLAGPALRFMPDAIKTGGFQLVGPRETGKSTALIAAGSVWGCHADSSLPDHFALTGAFEVCADRLLDDARLEAPGTKLLDQLIGDMEHLEERCTFFAAIFMLTIARLAQHQRLRRKPAFWRRLAAAANASLVTRACGSDNAESLFKWVADHSGKPFVFSILLEEVSDPRWRADWLSGRHLVADVFGRIDAAHNKLREQSRPSEWTTRIEKARVWIRERHLDLFAALPAIGESARRLQPRLEETHGFRDRFQKFCEELTVNALIDCTPGIYIFGVPEKVSEACNALMANLQTASVDIADKNIRFALQLLSYVAVLAQDESLADSVAQFSIEKARELKDNESSLELLCWIVECASAYSDRVRSAETLARRLESLAFLVKPSGSLDLLDSLNHLQLLDNNLSRRLGRAKAATRLARRAA